MSWLYTQGTKTLKKLLGDGGAGLSEESGQDSLHTVLKNIVDQMQNRLLGGLALIDSTTGNTQATGTGTTVWRINIEKGILILNGVKKEFAVQTDFSIHSGSYLTGFANGKSCIAAIVAKVVAGTITCVAVKGTAATTGSQVAPTNAQIQAALGSGVKWVKLGETTINRTGNVDTTTTSHDNSLGDCALTLTVE